MALPKIEPLSSEFEVTKNDSNAVKVEIEKLGKAIFEKTNTSLKSATQAVISDVPGMIQTLTQEIESGPIETFGNAINKLVKLVQDLGINLYDYNADLAKTVDRFVDKQGKLEEKLAGFREQGIRATIENNRIKILTEREVNKLVEKRQKNETKIQEKIENRVKLQEELDKRVHADSQIRRDNQKAIEKNEREISQLKSDNEEIDKATGKTADTGREVGGFSKIAELKEAFMVIPDTIAEVATGFKDVGKSIFQGIAAFIGNPMKAISKAFKGIANIFRTARLMIAIKVLALIAAFQFVAERIEMIGDIFRNIWSKITGFFKGIIDYIKNSKIGKLLGFGKDDDDEKPKRVMKNVDENTYDIGAETNLGDDTVMVGDENRRTSKDPSFVVDPVTNKIIQPGEEGYEEARANRLQNTQDYETDAQNFLLQGTGKTVDDMKMVSGNVTADGESTPKQLTTLLDAQKAAESGNIINVQNNNQIANNTSGGSNATIGFSTHLPDESFINVRKDNTTQSI